MAPNIEALTKRFDTLKGERGTWETHWEEIAERVLPRMSGTFTSKIQTKGDKRTQKMFDATAALGLERFAAVMESMLTPRNSRWHRLIQPDLAKDRQTRLYLDEVTDILFRNRYAPWANYASQQYEQYISLGAFGTGAKFIDEHVEGGLRYKAVPLRDLYFIENHQGTIDTVFREFKMSALQAVNRWGEKNLPDQIAKNAKESPERESDYLHVVMPRMDIDPTRADAKGMKFASYYIAKEHKHLVKEEGYHTFPYSISRYVTAPGEVFGRGPAMLVLPSIKVLNEQKKTVLKQGHRVVDPVLLAHDDGVLDTFSLKPGAINAGGVSSEGRALVHTLPTGNLAVGYEMMNEERRIINDAFLVTLFQILTENPQMTATEVLERTREKGMLLAPTMGRQQSESLGPQIEREIEILARQGILPPMPPALAEFGGEYSIEYDSPLSRAQKAEEASGLFRSFEMAQQYATITGDVSVYDHFNMDVITPDVMNINAVPEKWQNSIEDIQAIRQSRAEQATTKQAIEAAPAMAGMAKAAQ